MIGRQGKYAQRHRHEPKHCVRHYQGAHRAAWKLLQAPIGCRLQVAAPAWHHWQNSSWWVDHVLVMEEGVCGLSCHVRKKQFTPKGMLAVHAVRFLGKGIHHHPSLQHCTDKLVLRALSRWGHHWLCRWEDAVLYTPHSSGKAPFFTCQIASLMNICKPFLINWCWMRPVRSWHFSGSSAGRRVHMLFGAQHGSHVTAHSSLGLSKGVHHMLVVRLLWNFTGPVKGKSNPKMQCVPQL